ncbi:MULTISPECIES: RraA family protein [Ramlibacter]|uniref:Putative 4-hydroxy-4-methyl-2-oxoglutarate aldolase n=1 Tax=Ramlibacter pinisoli TaxID=2682844 RepID=A0A6N8J0I7_9BURK|nr:MULTISPECIES: RraA family protein [Ramlibacter]MBA2961754.1 RraA family protein [Ramlibacter sp. CGMCC 1.13660]MVQ31696.1 RraA family protein [Ramlibacter pinisoli]
MPNGFQVLKRKSSVAPALLERLRAVPVANISDSMRRMAAAGSALRPLHREGVLCGPALTVRTRPGDNLMLHMALNLAQEGDVLVVDADGDLTNAITGERMLAYCVAKKFAGVVIYGAVRDYGWIRRQDLPVYACGVTHRGPYKDGPGEINVPVSLGRMVVHPGDAIVGDEDGLVCVPMAGAEAVCAAAEQKFKKETETFGEIGKKDNDAAGYKAKLLRLGCTFEE